MERRLFLKGLFTTASVIAIPTVVKKTSEVLDSNKFINVDESSTQLIPYEWEKYLKYSERINKIVDTVNPMIDEMWKTITKKTNISSKLGCDIRYHLDEWKSLVDEMELFRKNGDFKSWQIENHILSAVDSWARDVGFNYSISYIAEGKYELSEHFISNLSKYVQNTGSHFSTLYSRFFGNIYLRYEQNQLAIKYYSIAIQNGHSIKRFFKSLTNNEKVKIPPMYEIPFYSKKIDHIYTYDKNLLSIHLSS